MVGAWEASEVLPLQRGLTTKDLAMLKEGTKSFGVVSGALVVSTP